MDTTLQHTKYTRFMLFILAIVLLIASIIGYSVSQKMSPSGGASATNDALRTTNSPIPTPTLIPYPVKGALTLQLKNTTPLTVGDTVVFDILATSEKDTVAGYDIVLSYDKATFENQMIQNKSDSFRIFTYKRPNHISVSATKNISASEPIRFASTTLLSASFIAKQKGTYTFSLKPIGNESSKFVSEAAAVTYPETSDISLEIK